MKRKIILSTILILIITLSLVLVYPKKENQILKNQSSKKNNFLSIMIEEQAGTGKYNKTDEFPQTGYVLNSNLSKCLNGSKIKYENGSISVIGTKADRCYVYFDFDALGSLCRNQNMAECFIKNYQKDGSIIYHDGLPDYDGMANANLEASDLSYRYSGGNDVVHNYVCFGSKCSIDPENPGYKNLYRIIGLFKNDSDEYEIKIIKADAATKEDLGDETYPGSAYYGSDGTPNKQYYKGKLTSYGYYYWNSTDNAHLLSENNTNVNMWKESNLNTKNLNGKYYGAIEATYKAMIVEHEWQVGGYLSSENVKATYDVELGTVKLTKESKNCYDQGKPNEVRQCDQNNDLIYKAHVGLMYVSDYMYGTLSEYWTTKGKNYSQEEIKDNNWLYLGLNEWILPRSSAFGDRAIYVGYLGDSYYDNYVYGASSIRPCLYLSSDVKITGGSGTETNPYRLEV